MERLTGKKLTLIQRLQLKLFQKKIKKYFAVDKGVPTEKQKKLGKISMILGISSFVLVFIPIVGIFAIPAAVVLGAICIKGNSNTQGLVGLITGIVFLVLLLVLVAALFASFGLDKISQMSG